MKSPSRPSIGTSAPTTSFWLLTPLLLLISVQPCIADVKANVQVAVTVIEDPRLTALNSDELKQSVELAAQIIHQVCQRTVTFKVRSPSVELDAFILAEEERIAPFRVPPDSAPNPFDLQDAAIRERITSACHSRSDLVSLNIALEAYGLGAHKTLDNAATSIANRYIQGLSSAKATKDRLGKPLLTAANWHNHSAVNWGCLLHSRARNDDYHLFLSNTILLDTGLEISSPNELAAGPINVWTVLPASRTAILCYGPVLDADAWKICTRMPLLERREAPAVVGALIAQSIGVHLLEEHGHSHKPNGGLARPFSALREKQDILDISRMKLGDELRRGVNAKGSEIFKSSLIVQVARAQQNWNEVLRECKYIVARHDKLEMSDNDLEYFLTQAREALQK